MNIRFEVLFFNNLPLAMKLFSVIVSAEQGLRCDRIKIMLF